MIEKEEHLSPAKYVGYSRYPQQIEALREAVGELLWRPQPVAGADPGVAPGGCTKPPSGSECQHTGRASLMLDLALSAALGADVVLRWTRQDEVQLELRQQLTHDDHNH